MVSRAEILSVQGPALAETRLRSSEETANAAFGADSTDGLSSLMSLRGFGLINVHGLPIFQTFRKKKILVL